MISIPEKLRRMKYTSMYNTICNKVLKNVYLLLDTHHMNEKNHFVYFKIRRIYVGLYNVNNNKLTEVENN